MAWLGITSPIEVLDLILAGLLMHQALVILRDRGASQVALNLLLVGFFTFLAAGWHFMILGEFFQQISTVALAACVVLFQPEARRLLGNIGRYLGPTFALTGDGSRYIDEIALAAEAMSRLGMGALIGIERAVGIETLAAAGVVLNAELSAGFLMTIFFPGSPFHDGAVLVRRGTVLAAACLVPVYSGVVVEGLGMRHRAGIGLSIDTDAIAVVVSEETGIISMAEAGRLVRRLEATRLGEELSRALGVNSPAATWRGWCTRVRSRFQMRDRGDRTTSYWRLMPLSLALMMLALLWSALLKHRYL